jgi:hypothetical protein
MLAHALSTLEIWYFDGSRMILVYTSLIHDGKGLSSCTRLQALDLIAYSTRMVRRYQILGILNIYVGFILDQLRTSFLMPEYGYFQYNSILPGHD